MAPYSGTVYDLAAGKFLEVTQGVERVPEAETQPVRDPRAAAALSALQDAVRRLSAAAQDAGGRPNKELRRMAEQVRELLDEWNADRF